MVTSKILQGGAEEGAENRVEMAYTSIPTVSWQQHPGKLT